MVGLIRSDLQGDSAGRGGNPGLGDAVLPCAAEGTANWLAPKASAAETPSPLGFASRPEIKFLNRRVRPRLLQLLHDPQRARIACDVEVQCRTSVIADDEEANSEPQSERRHVKKPSPQRSDHGFSGKSACAFPAPGSWHLPEPAGHRGFRSLESKHQQATVKCHGSPVLDGLAIDQFSNLPVRIAWRPMRSPSS
jgi:hypothetical protein